MYVPINKRKENYHQGLRDKEKYIIPTFLKYVIVLLKFLGERKDVY